MNFKIKLRKTTKSPATIKVDFLLGSNMLSSTTIHMVNDAAEATFTQRLELHRSYTLRISRYEDQLYSTNNLVHDCYVVVEDIEIDNFWSINEQNHWSKTVYDSEYRQHLSDKPVTWELSKDLYNNILFFNGSLDYTIQTPIRSMFFK
jgi:hypothetical protein